MELTSQIIGAGGLAAGGSTVEGKGDSRVNLSILHLLSAATFSRRLGEIEAENAGREFGDFWNDIFAQSTGAIFASVAALEAYANELFIDHADVFPELRDEVMAKLWELYEQKPTLEKYEFALLLKQSEFDRGSSRYQDIAALIKLRNGLIHFKPEWFSAQDEHAKLSTLLHHRAERSPFFPSSEPLFPRGWTSHKTAIWAVRAVMGFLVEFERRSKVRSRMDKFVSRFDVL